MPPLTAPEISQLLRELGDHMAMQGGNPYRARAYNRAADNLTLSTIPIDQLIAEDRLKEIPGVGDALAAVITKLHETGGHPRLEKMRSETPEGVLEMLRIPGLRPDRIKKLHSQRAHATDQAIESH
jgi:DNA polymerase (family X)